MPSFVPWHGSRGSQTTEVSAATIWKVIVLFEVITFRGRSGGLSTEKSSCNSYFFWSWLLLLASIAQLQPFQTSSLRGLSTAACFFSSCSVAIGRVRKMIHACWVIGPPSTPRESDMVISQLRLWELTHQLW